MDRDRAGGADGLGGQAALGHGHDEAHIFIAPLLLGDGGGQGIALLAAHQLALIVPVVGEGILPGEVRIADGQGHVPQGDGGLGVVEGDIDLRVLREGDLHGAVVHGPALGANAGGVVGVGLPLDVHGRGVGDQIFADAGVGAVPVIGVGGVVVVGVDGDTHDIGLAGADRVGADVLRQTLAVAGSGGEHGPGAVVGVADRALPGLILIWVRGEGGGRQGRQQDH